MLFASWPFPDRLRPLLLSALALASLGAPLSADAAPAKAKSAPAESLAAAPLPANLDQKKLDAALKAFDAPQADLGTTQAVIVVRKGARVREAQAARRQTNGAEFSSDPCAVHARLRRQVERRLGKMNSGDRACSRLAVGSHP